MPNHQMLLNTYTVRDAELNYHHTVKQSSIGFGTALISAAQKVIIPCPWKVLTLRHLMRY